MSPEAKKLVSVLATSTTVTETRGEAIEAAEIVGEDRNDEENKGVYPNLVQVPCIQYPITFR